ncbi:hypothetical protein [Marinibactrum halimedae]|uniref:Cytochrome c domain-containing protein n=1 Tax=Marinibactrum halimedae TaxID=1444977 RepID=A0AA37T263_9GAMM|nr:hypothetical protein [Marinibactrum halimedae]MCD9457689.1 hypothetical protein [Marinibactrum halimedae]GLS24938.1 hypothetical protein GCM10007877_06520 [Marinibactrum halimedae]
MDVKGSEKSEAQSSLSLWSLVVVLFSLLMISESSYSFEAFEADCENDPRVETGLVSLSVCVGAKIFFEETFDGNGRTCGTCHRAEDNFTISPQFIKRLSSDDPLFVASNNVSIATLERPDFLRNFALILENVDGREDLDNKFTLRSIPHTLSMATSLAPDVTDGTTIPPFERTGWSGDGAPNDGTLRDFLTGAVIQHFPKDLSRVDGVSFRLPTEEELDFALDFQIALGRTNEIDLSALQLNDNAAQAGIDVFLNQGRCNACHLNAGANFIVNGNNRNFNTGTEAARLRSVDAANIPRDGGFGGAGLTEFNVDTNGDNINDAFGNGTFNSPPLIEAADTGPFFHTNASGDLEEAIEFYNSDAFANSPSGQVGSPINLSRQEVNQVGRLLRVLNAALNIDMALQRLEAVIVVLDDFNGDSLETQIDLIELAQFELEDARQVLLGTRGRILHQSAARDLQAALQRTRRALGRDDDDDDDDDDEDGDRRRLMDDDDEDDDDDDDPIKDRDRRRLVNQAIDLAERARAEFGQGIFYELGEGNLIR